MQVHSLVSKQKLQGIRDTCFRDIYVLIINGFIHITFSFFLVKKKNQVVYYSLCAKSTSF